MTKQTRQRIWYVLLDLVSCICGMALFCLLRYHVTPSDYLPDDFWEWLLHYPYVLAGVFAYPVLFVSVSAVSGYYNDLRLKSRLDDVRNALICGAVTALLVFLLAMVNESMARRVRTYELLVGLWAALAVPPMLARLWLNSRSRRRLRKMPGIYRAVIIGTPDDSSRLQQRLRGRRPGQIQTFHIVDTLSPELSDDELLSRLHALAPQTILLCRHPQGTAQTYRLLGKLYATEAAIYLPLEFYRMATPGHRIGNVVGEPLINVSYANLSPLTVNLKRMADIACSAAAMLVLAPVYAAVAAVIKIDDPASPVLYSQERIGYRKRPFKIYKFRTMVPDAEAAGPALSSEHDPRITRVGHTLRKYRLDELPQFWNVLRGDMSLVGPRPERRYYIDQLSRLEPRHSLLHQVRPGITSWGVVKYGYASSVDQMLDRMQYDLLYVENMSMAVDLKILFHTFSTIIHGRGM